MAISDILLRTVSHPPLTTKGSVLTWEELDQNFIELYDYVTSTSGNVVGAGTTNFIPVWYDSTTLADSMIYSDGNFVGINTTTQVGGEVFHAYNNTNPGYVGYLEAADGGGLALLVQNGTLAANSTQIAVGIFRSFDLNGFTCTSPVLYVNDSSGSGAKLIQCFVFSEVFSVSATGAVSSASTYNGLTLTAAADGFTIAGGTISRTLTVTGGSTTLSGGGTLSLGGYTLTVPATGTAVLGTGTTNYVSYWTGTNTQAGSANWTYNGVSSTIQDGTAATQGIFNISSTYSGASSVIYGLKISKANANTSFTGLYIDGSDGLCSTMTNSGIGIALNVTTTSTSGTIPIQSTVSASSTTSTETALSLRRAMTSGNGASGNAVRLTFSAPTTSSVQIVGQLDFKWTDATHASRTGAFIVNVVNGGVSTPAEYLRLSASTLTFCTSMAITPQADGFTIAGGTVSRTLTITGGAVAINQNLQTTNSPSFAGLTLTGNLNVSGAQAYSAFVGLSDGANIATNCNTGMNFSVTLAGNRTLDNPTNMQDGATYTWKIKQDATGSRTLAYGAKFTWGAAGTPVLTTTANATDYIVGIYNSAADTIAASIIKGF